MGDFDLGRELEADFLRMISRDKAAMAELIDKVFCASDEVVKIECARAVWTNARSNASLALFLWRWREK